MQKKIHIAIVTNDLSINGISVVVMNYCNNIDLNKFKIDILAGTPIDKVYKKKCDQLKINIKEMPSRKASPKTYYKTLFKEFRNNNYDIAHIHGNSATITVELFLAWLNNIKVRIAHSHNCTCNYMKTHKILLPLFNRLYTHRFACSSLAGHWLFGNKKFYIISNGFNTERFKFNQEIRDEVRKELDIQDKFLIGHIGRFNDQKNHIFLLKIFQEVAKINPDAYLILVGDGPDFDKINQLIKEHPYTDRIIVYGETNQTEFIYNAMDIFVFPSKYEGLGIVALEAQISGLPCCVSDVVPKDVLISDNMNFLPLNDMSLWVDNILKYTHCNNNRSFIDETKIRKFDIQTNVNNLESLYIKFFKEKY